jgi:hypothetical protein
MADLPRDGRFAKRIDEAVTMRGMELTALTM